MKSLVSWVADTVHAVSGIRPDELHTIDSENPSSDGPPNAMIARRCGVYFLYLGGQLQYIGQSRNIYSRIAKHMESAPFEFDRFVVSDCAPGELAEKEAAAIRLFEPKWNRDYPAHGGRKYEYRGTR